MMLRKSVWLLGELKEFKKLRRIRRRGRREVSGGCEGNGGDGWRIERRLEREAQECHVRWMRIIGESLVVSFGQCCGKSGV